MFSKTTISKIIRILSLILCVSFIASTCIAATYYVDKNHSSASNSNSGSETSPWETIQHAAQTLTSGDTVYVKQGVYNGQIVITKSGSSDTSRITFAAYPGHRPILDGSVGDIPSWKGIITAGSNSGGPDYITIDGFEIRNNNYYLIRVDKGDHWTIRNCLFHDAGKSAILMSQVDYALIQNNEVYNAAWNGINIMGGSNTIIERNYTHDNDTHYGLQIITNHTVGDTSFYYNNIVRYNIVHGNRSGMYFRNNINLSIYGNVIYDNTPSSGYAGIHLGQGDGASGSFSSNSKIYNNTIVGHPKSIYNESFNDLQIYNNIFYKPSSETLRFSSDATIGHSINYNNYYGKDYSSKGSQGFYADPEFVDATNKDFNLKPGSPALGSGENGDNIGALPFPTFGNESRPSAPTNLSITH